MTKNKFSKYFIFITFLTAFTIFFIIFHRSYSNLVKPLNQVQTSNLLKPIDPKIDQKTVEEINKREELNE